MTKGFVFIVTIVFLMGTVMGCNMLRGVGKDVQSAGDSIQKTVDHND